MRHALSRAARITTVIALVGGVVAAAGPAAAAPAGATTTAPAERITLNVLSANGSGCPNGTADVTMSPDNTSFTVTYREFVADAGGSAAPTAFRKNCQVGVQINVPHGFTYAIAKATFRGWAHLDRDASAMQRAYYYFQGKSETAISSHYFDGPFYGDWRTSDTAEVATMVFAPCGEHRLLNINSELRVTSDSPSRTSHIGMDSSRGGVNTVYQLAWKRCP